MAPTNLSSAASESDASALTTGPESPRTRDARLASRAQQPAPLDEAKNASDETNEEKQEEESSHELSRLETLPLPLFHDVMGFALGCTHKSARQPRTAAERELDEIALVSKALRVHATEIQGQLALGKMLFWVTTGSRKEMLALRRELLLRRVYVRELEVNVFPPTALTIPQANEWLRGVLDQVAAMVSLAPQLELLDLGACCGDVSGIVRAAATNCLQLQALQLPTDRMDDQQGRAGQAVDMAPLMDALSFGLEQWHRRSGGLRQLRIPSRQNDTAHRFTNSVDFLRRVYTYCPRIELLDAAVSQWVLEEGMDEWIIDRSVWERFSETATSLREFDWVTVPWATDFFEIFAKYKKPRLTDLSLKTTMQWDWDAYFDQVGHSEAAAIKVSGFGASANRVHLVLKACPGLKRLTITPNSRVSNDDPTLDAMLDLEEYDGRQAPLPYKKDNAMNQALFNDNFCRALVRHCPLLEEFKLLEDHQSLAATMKRVRPIMRFQDAALQSLAQLKHLSVVDLKAVNITGKGLFDLVNSPASEAHGTRCYDVAIGDERGDLAKSFYSAMEDFLRCMVEYKGTLPLSTKRVYMCVINGNTSAVDEQWGANYLARLKGAIPLLRRKYPSITFRVETDGLTSQSFSTIYGFGLYTAGAKQPADSRWVDLPAEALEEDIFVIEEVMDELNADGEHGEEEWEDEDDDFEDEDEFSDEDEFEDPFGSDDEDFDSDEDDDEQDDDDDDEDGDNDSDGSGPGGRRRPRNFFNGVPLPDIGALAIDDNRPGDEEDDDNDHDDHAFDDQDGYDY